MVFINLEYWFCLVYSIFGGRCVLVGTAVPGETAVSVATTTETAVNAAATSSPHLWNGILGIFAGVWHVIEGAVMLLWAFFAMLSFTFSGIILLIMLVSVLGLLYIRYKELGRYGTLPPTVRTINPFQNRWQALLEDAKTTDPKRWRKAVVEADGILGELLAKLTYAGSSTAERLRNVPDEAFVTLSLAWEAHRVKNFVAAKRSNFILTQREAFRIMKLYEQVFEEFDFI